MWGGGRCGGGGGGGGGGSALLYLCMHPEKKQLKLGNVLYIQDYSAYTTMTQLLQLAMCGVLYFYLYI